MSECIEGAERVAVPVRGGFGNNSTGIILVLFILLVIIGSIFFI